MSEWAGTQACHARRITERLASQPIAVRIDGDLYLLPGWEDTVQRMVREVQCEGHDPGDEDRER